MVKAAQNATVFY